MSQLCIFMSHLCFFMSQSASYASICFFMSQFESANSCQSTLIYVRPCDLRFWKGWVSHRLDNLLQNTCLLVCNVMTWSWLCHNMVLYLCHLYRKLRWGFLVVDQLLGGQWDTFSSHWSTAGWAVSYSFLVVGQMSYSFLVVDQLMGGQSAAVF